VSSGVTIQTSVDVKQQKCVKGCETKGVARVTGNSKKTETETTLCQHSASTPLKLKLSKTRFISFL
jgi:hypothetical protein